MSGGGVGSPQALCPTQGSASAPDQGSDDRNEYSSDRRDSDPAPLARAGGLLDAIKKKNPNLKVRVEIFENSVTPPTTSDTSGRDFVPQNELCYADILKPEQAISRIEEVVVRFLDASGPWTLTTKSMRAWKMMGVCHWALLQKHKLYPRQLFYLLNDGESTTYYFPNESHVTRTIEDLVELLQCSRYCFAIFGKCKGLVAGCISIKGPDTDFIGPSKNLSSTHQPCSYSIVGDLIILDDLEIRTDAQYIIVVAEHITFQTLISEDVFSLTSIVLITGKGYPDTGTRFFLHRLSRLYPEIPILGLVDWSPYGLDVLCSYKHGCTGVGLENYRLGCDVKWLGLRLEDVEDDEYELLTPLMEADHRIARRLKFSTQMPPDYRVELDAMVLHGHKAEIQAADTKFLFHVIGKAVDYS